MEFVYHTENQNAAVTLTEHSGGDGIILLDVDIAFPEPVIPLPVTIEWKCDCIDSYCVWGPNDYYTRNLGPEWKPRVTTSCLAIGEPVQQILSAGGKNRVTIAISDAAIPTEIATGVLEEEAKFRCQARFFVNQIHKIDHYHAVVYINMSDRPYSAVLRSVRDFWVSCGYLDAYIPDAARRPMYSTWYAFHQGLSADTVLEQCRMAVQYGMDSVIVDDGWQKTVGEWNVNHERIADMRAFVDSVHALGMKFLLWFSMPFLDKNAACYPRFADMVLNPSATFFYFDPRFPEVRHYLAETYANAAETWKLDGLKLDFIDYFRYYPDTPSFDERWDTPSIHEAVDWMMQEISTSLRAVNPEIMIEFRQPYYGPTISKYASMVRVGDCPNDGMENHVRGITLRYSLGHTPVHSDMLMWNPRDTVESAARQVIATMFLVPQISVRLNEIPEDHRKMLSFYLHFWNQHRDVLLDGILEAEHPEALYTVVTVQKNGHWIASVHSASVLKIGEFQSLHLMNATDEQELYVSASVHAGEIPFTVYSCTGETVESGTCTITPGMHAFSVPVGGMLVLGE